MASPRAWSTWFGIDSDRRKLVSVGANVNWDENDAGGWGRSAGLNITYRPSSSVEISSGPNYQRGHQLAQYVGTFQDLVATPTFGSRYVFSTLEQKEFSLQTRVNYVLSPKMSLQVYLQPLVSVGDYQTFKELAAPRAFDFTRYGIDRGTIAYDASRRRYTVDPGDGGSEFSFGDPDFNFKSLRLNAIFRWEWKPGSAMYLVWTEQRQDTEHPGEFLFNRDLRSVFGAPADDVVLFKIAYWFQR
jgi:hypothetical protein